MAVRGLSPRCNSSRRHHATVTSAEYHGADSIVTARVGDASLVVRAPGEMRLAPGSQVRLGWEPGAVHIFNSEGRKTT